MERSGIYSDVDEGAIGNGGNIEITTGSLMATNKSEVYAQTSGQGNAGNIIINARDHIFSDAETPFASSIERGGVGQGGNITIITNTLSFTSGAQLITRTRGRGDAGSIFITARDAVSFTGVAEDGNPSTGAFSNVRDDGVGQGGNVEITAGSLSVTDGAQLTADTSAQGNAGSVIIKVRDGVLFAGTTPDLQFGSVAGSTVEEGAIGTGGNVEITAGSLLVQGGAQLLSATEGEGDAGNVIIQVRDWVAFDGESSDGRFATSIFSSVQSGATGKGGNVEISTSSLFLTNGAQLVAATRGQGDAGKVIIQASEQVVFDGVSEIGELSSGVFSNVDRTGVGKGGNIDISTDSLFLTNGGGLNADTFGQGNAGNVIIRANEAVFLEGISRNGSSGLISTLTAGQGRGGTITVSAPFVYVADGAVVDARTVSSERGGDITVNADSFAAVNGGQIITSTQRDGQAGNIMLNANRISLSGRNPVPVNQLDSVSIARRQGNGESGLFANTSSNSTGVGGTITLNTNTLSLSDRSQISANSQGTGKAGGIDITVAETLTLNNSDITTASTQSAGGAINITASDIRLYEDGDITTSVFSGAGGGGNITINADSVIAYDDSDILAFAQDGRGGDITFNTPAFFGENFQPAAKNTDPETLDNNDRVDINASGAVEGNIDLPDVSAIQNGITPVRDNLINTEELIASSCIARTEQPESTFFITGTGGFAERPGDAQTSIFPLGTIRNIPSESDTPPSRTWQEGDPIIEPQGVYRLPNGELVLSRECPE
ncbi:beta strand repeat-containing protein [Lyngbya aestuarii]|uniref:beta strand repeat-containing protein n=1 Tax=Lyngbya aestuarii TaxID=118322 RepID=UPI00403D72A9